MKARLFSYNYIDTFIHRLSGLIKVDLLPFPHLCQHVFI